MDDLTPISIDEAIAKLLKGKSLAKLDMLSIRPHVGWNSLSWKGLYQIALSELFYSDKCKGGNALAFGEYDSVPFFSAIYKGDKGLCGICITASTKSENVRMGYGVINNGTVSVVKSSTDMTYDGIPSPYKAVGKQLSVLAKKYLGQRSTTFTRKDAEKAAEKTIALSESLEKSKKREALLLQRLEKLEALQAEKDDSPKKVVTK